MFRYHFKFLKLTNRYIYHLKSIRCCSTISSESSQAQLLPSQPFMVEAAKRDLAERLSKVIAEIEVMKEFTHEVPISMNDSQWDFLLHIRNFEEREQFLRNIYFNEVSQQRNDQMNESENYLRSKILAEKQEKFDAGEMVYGRGFYDYLDLRGRDFRRQINVLHGSRLLAQERVDEKMPQIILDCRYLAKNGEKNIAKFVGQVKSLYDNNWFHPHPSKLSICNLLMNDFVARLVRSKWSFAFGISPSVATLDQNFPKLGIAEFNDIQDLLPVDDSEECINHEFTPRITSRGVKSVLDAGIQPHEVAVISRSATRFLDDDISKFKAFVLHTTAEGSGIWQTPSIAASNDGFLAYRFPIEKHVKWEQGPKDLTLSIKAAILKMVYTGEASWKEALLQKVPNHHFEKRQLSTEEIGILRARNERNKAMKEAVKQLHFRKMNPSPPSSKHQYENKNRIQQPSSRTLKEMNEYSNEEILREKLKEKHPHRIHKYTREERNRMKLQQANN